MKTLILASLILGVHGQDVTEKYSDPKTGLEFSHPKTWTVIKKVTKKKKPKKGSSEGDVVSFRVPIVNSSSEAELTVVRAEFAGSPESWQQIQVDANRTLKREVQKQYQQEILGVPMLLTRIAYSEDGVSKTALTGLLYTSTPYKFLFRLAGPSNDFDKAEYEFTKSMETLRTLDNNLPKEQKPGVVPVVTPEPPKKSVISVDTNKTTVVKAKQQLPITISNRNTVLRFPEGWTATKDTNGNWKMSHKNLPYAVELRLYWNGDSDAPAVALAKLTSETLNDYSVVDLREDPVVHLNAAGMTVASVWRTGKSGKNEDLRTVEGLVKTDDFYITLRCRPSTKLKDFESEKKLLLSLLQSLSIEPAP